MLPCDIIQLIDNYISVNSIKVTEESRDNVIYVKDLCFCKEKAYLRRKYKHIDLEILKKPSVKFGILIHNAIQEILRYHDFLIEVSREMKIGDYIIKGRIDAILETSKGRYGVEIKMSDFALDPYKVQAKIYNTLFDLDSTILLLVNERKMYGINICSKYEVETIEKMINNWKSPMYSFECERCEYSELCSIVKQKRLANY